MRSTANRLVLALTGTACTLLAAAILLAAAGARPPRWCGSWLPAGPASPVLPPSVPAFLSFPRPWEHPLSLGAAAVTVLGLVLLIAEAVPRTPARLRLSTCDLATTALTSAVRSRAELIPGVARARVRISRGRRPRLELTARIGGRTAPAETVEPLLSLLAEASDSTGLPFRPHLRLVPARVPRQRLPAARRQSDGPHRNGPVQGAQVGESPRAAGIRAGWWCTVVHRGRTRFR